MKNLLPNPYLLGIGMTLLAYILIYGLKRLLSTRIGRSLKLEHNKWDDIVVYTVEHTTHFFMLASALYLASQYTPLYKELQKFIDRGYFLITMLQVGIWGNCLLDVYITKSVHRKARNNKAAATSISLLKFLAKFTLFSVVFLFTLNNLDIKITTMLAGLGVGGIAVALAIQKILGDLLSSLSIVLDRPFVVGDFIILDQYLGEVEKIGLRTTHLRSLSGEQLIIPNSDILATKIRNMHRMPERRVVFLLSLKLESSPEEIEQAVELITGIVHEQRNIRFDRCHLKEITRTSFDLETVYFCLSGDYNLFMDIQQKILLGIYRAFQQHQLSFAYPAQILYHLPLQIKMNSFSHTTNEAPLSEISNSAHPN